MFWKVIAPAVAALTVTGVAGANTIVIENGPMPRDGGAHGLLLPEMQRMPGYGHGHGFDRSAPMLTDAPFMWDFFGDLYERHLDRQDDWAGLGHGTHPWPVPPRPEMRPIPLPGIGPDAPEAGDLPDMMELFRDGTVKLVFECTVEGTPVELPNDIRIANPYLFATDAGVTLDWSAPLGAEGTLELPSLAPGESAYLLDVLPRGMAAGTVCTAVQR